MEQSLSQNKKKFFIYMIAIMFLSVIVIGICLCVGRYNISIAELISALLGEQKQTTAYNILWHIRIPRICVSYVIGTALAVSGTVYQSLFNNRLVSPGLLGVEAGACVGAGICILLGAGAVLTSVVSFGFGIFAAILAVVIQRVSKSESATTLVLSGVIVSALMNANIGLIKYIADGKDKLASITFWMLGDLSGAELEDLYLLLPIVVVCSAFLYFMRWRLNALSLGEKEAKSLGINYKLETVLVISSATLLTSVSVCISGTIGWVGLIIPNIAKGLFGNDNKQIIPVSLLLGGIFMVIVDTLARTLSPSEIPLGIITGFLGAITYVVILVKKGASA